MSRSYKKKIIKEPYEDTDSTSETSSYDYSNSSDSDSNFNDGYNSKTKKNCTFNQRKTKVMIHVAETQYDLVKDMATEKNWKLTRRYDAEWDIFWTDGFIDHRHLQNMKPYQKINRFPGSHNLGKKNFLAKNLMKMLKKFPEEYRMFPKTWTLPTDFGSFKAELASNNGKTYIIKPDAACQGKGIYLSKTCDQITEESSCVVQRYLEKPYLINELKFDLRLYVLVTGCDPLRVYLFEDGLARFATEKYSRPNRNNIEETFIHLTNYAINKENSKFVFNKSGDCDDIGHKKSFKAILQILREMGEDVETLLEKIKDVIMKTLFSVQPIIADSYKICQPFNYSNDMCFEVLGFDIMIDNKLKPWLIEVNHNPSFVADTPLDEKIKQGVLDDTIQLLNIDTDNKKNYRENKRIELQKRILEGKRAVHTAEEKQLLAELERKRRDSFENKNLGRFERIYPVENDEKYQEYSNYLRCASELYEKFTGANIQRNKKYEGDPSKLKDVAIIDKSPKKIQKNIEKDVESMDKPAEKKINKYYIKNKSVIKGKYGINVALKKINKNAEQHSNNAWPHSMRNLDGNVNETNDLESAHSLPVEEKRKSNEKLTVRDINCINFPTPPVRQSTRFKDDKLEETVINKYDVKQNITIKQHVTIKQRRNKSVCYDKKQEELPSIINATTEVMSAKKTQKYPASAVKEQIERNKGLLRQLEKSSRKSNEALSYVISKDMIVKAKYLQFLEKIKKQKKLDRKMAKNQVKFVSKKEVVKVEEVIKKEFETNKVVKVKNLSEALGGNLYYYSKLQKMR